MEIVSLIASSTQRVLLEAVEDLKERVVPLAERCSEFQNLNDALNDQLVDMQHQMTISRDKLKRARLSLQNEKEESKRLRLAFERQRIAKEGEVTEKKEMQAQLDSKDKEVSFLFYFRPFSPNTPLLFFELPDQTFRKETQGSIEKAKSKIDSRW